MEDHEAELGAVWSGPRGAPRVRSLGRVERPRSEEGAGRLLILVAGSRTKYYTVPGCVEVRAHLESTLTFLRPVALLTGGATGADRWGWQWGVGHLESRYNPVMAADWTRYGNKAGRIRNTCMADRVKAAEGRGWKVEVHLWWDMQSTGTMHMRDVAARRGLRVVVHDMSRHAR